MKKLAITIMAAIIALTISPATVFASNLPQSIFGIHDNSGAVHFNPAFAVGNNVFVEGERIGVLTVERLNCVVNVYEGATMRNMDSGAGRFEFSGANSGNTALIGHNRGRTNGFFSFVKDLREGDLITLDMSGIVRTYVVTHSIIVSETNFEPLMEFGHNRLSLVTCLAYRPRYREIAIAVEI